MGGYIGWDDVVNRYSILKDKVGASGVGSDYIGYAEAEVEGKLAPAFSIPFSSNNVTVKDLCIDTTLHKSIQFTDIEKAEKIMTSIDDRIKKLLDGSMTMVTTSGDMMAKDNDSAWSETQDYVPVYGKGDIEDFLVDSSQLFDEELRRD